MKKDSKFDFLPQKKEKKKDVWLLSPDNIIVYNSTKPLSTRTLGPISHYCRTLLFINSTFLEPVINLLYRVFHMSLNDCERTHHSQHACACPRLLAGRIKWKNKQQTKNTAVQMTRAGQEITERFMKWSGSLKKAMGELAAVDPRDRVPHWRTCIYLFIYLFSNCVALEGEDIPDSQNGRLAIYFHWRADSVPTRGALERRWGRVGEGVIVCSNRASNSPTPTPTLSVLQAGPVWPSSWLLSGDSVQPTLGRVEGAQRDQLQRMVPTQNPRRGNAVRRFEVGWAGEVEGSGGAYPSWMAPSQSGKKNREEALREVGFIFITVTGTTHKSINAWGDLEERQSGLGVAMSSTATLELAFPEEWKQAESRSLHAPPECEGKKKKKKETMWVQVIKSQTFSSSNFIYSSPPTDAATSLRLQALIPPSDMLARTCYICMWGSPVVRRANLELRIAVFSFVPSSDSGSGDNSSSWILTKIVHSTWRESPDTDKCFTVKTTICHTQSRQTRCRANLCWKRYTESGLAEASN